MLCKPCEMCAIGYVCRQADEDDSKCPVANATESDTIKISYKEE